ALVVLALAGASWPAFGEGSTALFLFFNVQPGSKGSFEQAIKRQMEARRAQNVHWRWLAWEYASGDLPRFCLATFGHSWSDFDQSAEAEKAEEGRIEAAAALSTQAPRAQFFEHLQDVSAFGSATNTPTMAEISVYQLYYGKEAQFYAALREFHDAIVRSGSDQRFEWFELRTGGASPQFMLLVPRGNWAAFDVSASDFQERLEKALGKGKTKRLFEQFTSAVKTHERSAVRLRLDLSLLPTK
ncbi:MAG TPA: hypothetical protein VLT36_07100, partial [Candidatus Dormibacteraeota bacterium]|nr:hypothetical protein [Candidatus Dormibacteraeota bacterium]